MDEARGPHPTSVEGKLGTHLRCVFFNTDVLVGLDLLACADGAAGPADLNCLNSGVAVYTEDSSKFALGTVTGTALDCPCLRSECGGYADLRADAVAVARFSDELDLNPSVMVAAIVSEKICRSIGGCNE